MKDALLERARQAFTRRHGAAPHAVAHAPGRVNLMGEHTDYNGGEVLPCAIGFGTAVAVAPRHDRRVRVVATDMAGQVAEFDLDAHHVSHVEARWLDYISGMAHAMGQHGLAIGGADLAVAGDVPRGAGLSSSASLCVAAGLALAAASGLDGPDPVLLATLAQRAENEFVGLRCGIMDQLVSARARAGHALRIDCMTLATTDVPVPEDLAVLIVDSGVRRGLVGSDYNVRRIECEAAARHHAVTALARLEPAVLEREAGRWDETLARRARHIVSDSARVAKAAAALARGDLEALGSLMARSHASMRDDFEISVPRVDALVALTQTLIGREGGARMTGGGFGGCIVAVMSQASAGRVRDAVHTGYRTPEGTPPRLWLTRPEAGASLTFG